MPRPLASPDDREVSPDGGAGDVPARPYTDVLGMVRPGPPAAVQAAVKYYQPSRAEIVRLNQASTVRAPLKPGELDAHFRNRAKAARAKPPPPPPKARPRY